MSTAKPAVKAGTARVAARAPRAVPAVSAPVVPTAPARPTQIEYGVFHCADLHTGAFRYIPDALSRTKKMFSEIKRVVLSIPARYRILNIVGDAYDRKTITEEERNAFIEFVVDMLLSDVHVILINGNHDFYNESLTLLEPVKQMARLAGHLHVHTKTPGVTTIGDISFGCVPCTQCITTDQLKATAAMLYKQAHVENKPPKAFYMLVHEAVFGAVNHKRTWKAKSDKYLRVPNLDFVTGWQLGDIHECQQIHERAWYSGAPYQVKSDESERCGILQWAGSRTRFHTLNVPGFRYTDNIEVAKKLAAEGHYVRFTGKASEAELKSLPTTVLCDGDIAAIELDVDVAVPDLNTSSLGSVDLISPLPEFLARDGCNERQQRRGVELVLGIKNMLAARADRDSKPEAGEFDEEE